MEFDWLRSVLVMSLFMLPTSLVAAIAAFVNEHWLVFCIGMLVFFATIFLLAGVPEEAMVF